MKAQQSWLVRDLFNQIHLRPDTGPIPTYLKLKPLKKWCCTCYTYVCILHTMNMKRFKNKS